MNRDINDSCNPRIRTQPVGEFHRASAFFPIDADDDCSRTRCGFDRFAQCDTIRTDRGEVKPLVTEL